MMWLWLAMNLQIALACAGTSDELRDGNGAIARAVLQGRCSVSIDLSR